MLNISWYKKYENHHRNGVLLFQEEIAIWLPWLLCTLYFFSFLDVKCFRYQRTLSLLVLSQNSTRSAVSGIFMSFLQIHTFLTRISVVGLVGYGRKQYGKREKIGGSRIASASNVLVKMDVIAYMCDICAKYIARMCNFAIQILTKR